MASRAWSIAAVLAGVCLCVVSAPLRAQTQQRVMYASAVDKDGNPVDGLGDTDFVIREDRVAREVLSVVPASQPMQIALLVDNSTAAERFIRDIRQGLTAFIKAIDEDPLGTRHEVAIITIGERPTINTEYTADLDRAAAGANRIFYAPNSGTYLMDGIMETSQGIRKKELTRPVMIAVITNGPELSGRVYPQVLDAFRPTGAAFHVMVLGSPITGNQDRLILLDMASREGGGRYDLVLTGAGLAPRLKQLADELTHQYRITYARPETLIPPEKVTVESAKPGLTVRGIRARDTGERGGR